MCPTVLRALFNYLDLDDQAERNVVERRLKKAASNTELVEYLQDGERVALTERRLGSGRERDPKWFRVDTYRWRCWQKYEGHRCNICVLAGTRPGVQSP